MNTKEICNFYLQGNSLNKTKEKFNFRNIKEVKEILLQNNIRIRSRQEQNKYNPQNQGSVENYKCFSPINLTEEGAYWLGFIAADGTVRKNTNQIKVGLASIDKAHLVKLKNFLGCKNKINERETKDGYSVCEIQFAHKQIKQDLSLYGIVPNKTYTNTISIKKIPQKLKPFFLLGYLDGDGSFSLNPKTNQCVLKIVSYGSKILQELNEICKNCGYIYNYKRGKNNLYSLEFSTSKTMKILSLYEKSNISLDRKKEKFKEIQKIRIK